MRVRGIFAAVVVALLGALTFVVARADPADKPTFRFSWARLSNAESCIDGAALSHDVTTRLGRNPFADDAPKSIEGSIVRDGAQWVAKFYVRDSNGNALGDRLITSDASDCASISAAITLAIAIAIDPDAAFGTPVSSSSSIASASSAPLASTSSSAPKKSTGNGVPMMTGPFIPRSNDKPARAMLSMSFLDGVVPSGNHAFGLIVDPSIKDHRYFHLRAHAFYASTTATRDGSAAIGLTALSVAFCAHDTNETFFALIACVGPFLGVEHAVAKVGTPLNPGDRPIFGGVLNVGVIADAPLVVVGGNLGLIVPFARPKYFLEGRPDPVFTPGFGIMFTAFVGLDL